MPFDKIVNYDLIFIMREILPLVLARRALSSSHHPAIHQILEIVIFNFVCMRVIVLGLRL